MFALIETAKRIGLVPCSLDCDELLNFSETEDLLGLSTYLEFDEADLNDPKYDGCLDEVIFSPS